MNLSEITFGRVRGEIQLFLQTEYSKAGTLFTNASPYGQILLVITNLYQLSMLYLKNTIKQFDLSDPNARNPRYIRNAAIFAGHIPTRATSATGTIKLTLKSTIDIASEIKGSRFTFVNRSRLRNKTNGLDYSVNLGRQSTTYRVTPNAQFFIPVIQGKWETRNFTGEGLTNQTISLGLRSNNQEVENFNYEVIVNGEYWATKKHIYDMLPDEKACVVRTGFDNGIDILFGNGGFGMIPPVGVQIQVNYLVSDGSIGSIFRRTANDWDFVDDVLDGNGNTINLSDLFNIDIFTDINFGADRETNEFTRQVIPISSNNFVLGTPLQFAYQIKKLGVFSHVNAYENDGVVYIVATPNIKLFRNQNANYFTIPVRAFELDMYEKEKIDQYLRIAGNLMLTRRYQITTPVLSYYVMNVFVITYSDAQEQSIRSQIYDRVSEYFLDFNRLGRVPKSDLIAQLNLINEIHSVDIQFVSKKNEDYHRNQIIADQNRRNQFASQSELRLARPNPTYDPNAYIGVDPTLGDILFEPNEIPIIRGGWVDRNDIYFSENLEDSGLKSINIIQKGTVDPSQRNKIFSEEVNNQPIRITR